MPKFLKNRKYYDFLEFLVNLLPMVVLKLWVVVFYDFSPLWQSLNFSKLLFLQYIARNSDYFSWLPMKLILMTSPP